MTSNVSSFSCSCEDCQCERLCGTFGRGFGGLPALAPLGSLRFSTLGAVEQPVCVGQTTDVFARPQGRPRSGGTGSGARQNKNAFALQTSRDREMSGGVFCASVVLRLC